MQVDAPSAVRAPALFGFSGSIAPTRLSWSYRLGLAIVAVAMLILPLLYLGVIALAGAGIWWHLTHNRWLLGDGSLIQFTFIAYATPAIAGGIVLLFMVKPVFVRPPARQPPLQVTPSDEPALFDFIEAICRHVGAPMPRRVQVDCLINASASFDRGVRSFVRRDLVLTIGLPLALDVSVRELAGVLAHEFGHFAQGSGLRLTVIIRRVNGWFARVIYERDIWDWRVAEWSKHSEVRFKLLILLSQAGVLVSRLALTGLMTAGQTISCFLLRQMEYDADSYEIKLAGTAAFIRTMTRVRELNRLALRCEPDLQACHHDGMMPADLPQFLAEWAGNPPADAPGETEQQPPETSGFLDSHPTDAERVRAAQAAEAPGILVGGEDAARHLFRDFASLSARATRRHYEILRLDVSDLRLIDTAEALRASADRSERRTSLYEIFDHGLSRFRLLTIPVADAESAVGEVQTWRLRDALQLYTERVAQSHKAFAALQLLHVGIEVFDHKAFDLPEWTLDAATRAEADALDRLGILRGVLEPYERKCMGRIGRGLAQATTTGATDAGDIAALITAFNAVSIGMQAWLELQRLDPACRLLGHLLEKGTCPYPDRARAQHEELTAAISRALERMRRAVLGVPCPRALASDLATLDRECERSTGGGDPTLAMTHMETIYVRLLFEVCVIVRRVERASQPATRSGD